MGEEVFVGLVPNENEVSFSVVVFVIGGRVVDVMAAEN